MPYKKRYAPKRNRRYKKVWKRKAPKPSSGITRPRVLRFKRSEATVISLNSASPPANWTADTDGALYQQFVTNLNSVPDASDFKNLFTAYRIKGVRIEGYYSNTSSDSNNQQTMLLWNQNWQGITTAVLSEQFFLDRPRSKRRLLLRNNGKKAFDIYQPMRVLSTLYNSEINSDYGTRKPMWIACGEDTTNHYGFNLRIQRVDGQTFTAGITVPYPSIKLITTWYMEFRGVS